MIALIYVNVILAIFCNMMGVGEKRGGAAGPTGPPRRQKRGRLAFAFFIVYIIYE
jgi:hypothetical protein